MKINKENYELLCSLSQYLNNAADAIEEENIRNIASLGISEEQAYAMLLAAILGLDLERARDYHFFETYFTKMIHKLDGKEYAANPYYRNIRIPSVKSGSCELKYEVYKPYEAFICDDFHITGENRIIPQIGFFDHSFSYPAILENGRIWMTTIPNEINTMKEAIEAAHGKVLTYGLGLGYYVYMVSEKAEVRTITVVEKEPEIIHLFETYILPQFRQKQKIRIIQEDAFVYAKRQMAQGKYDVIFTDLWHDVSDGVDLYTKMKTYEILSPCSHFLYWIKKSIECYM